MKRITTLLLCALLFVCPLVVAADSDGTPTTRVSPPGIPFEGPPPLFKSAPAIPPGLEDAYKAALETGNLAEQQRISALLSPYLSASSVVTTAASNDQPISAAEAAFSPVWSGNDIRVLATSVQYARYRHLDMKRGEDGNLYIAINRANVSGFPGRLDVYKSTNGGGTWIFVQGAQNASQYYGEISMLVEVRSASNFDSTRIIVFFTRSSSSALDGAAMSYVTFLRDGSAWYAGTITSPVTGTQHGSPTGVSDGMYYTSATYFGVVFATYNNAEDSCKGLHFYRTMNWGTSWTGTDLAGGYQDFYPTACMKPGASSSTDSIYVAVERRFNSPQAFSLVRVIASKFAPTAGDLMYYLPPSDLTYPKYEKPFIHVRQTGRNYGVSRDVIITVVKNTGGYYHMSTNGGGSWSLDANLASNVNVKYSFCTSDSLTAGGGYFMAAYIDPNGDTLGTRRGVPGSLGTRVYRNSHAVSPSVEPTCVIYKVGTTKYSAYAYAGFGPTDVWFNQETLTGVNLEEEVAQEYRLEQNFPNPFNPSTVIPFSIPERSAVSLKVYDIMGREVATLADGQMDAGRYTATFDASRFATGVYVYRLMSGKFTVTRKMVLTK